MVDDHINDLSMKPSRDDLVSRQASGKKGRPRSQKVALANPPQASRNGPLFVVLLLIAAGAGAGGWFMWQEMETLSQELSRSKELLSESRSSMGDLQQNLASQNENLSKAGSEVEQDLTLHMSEIRKLWDLSNKKNKPAIDKNAKAIETLKANLANQKKLVTAATKTAETSQKNVKALQTTLQEGALQAQVINSQVSELEAQLSELTAQNKAFKAMLESQEAAIDQINKTAGASLQTTLKEIAQRLDSIDAHRRQVNSRLNQHDRNISELYQKR